MILLTNWYFSKDGLVDYDEFIHVLKVDDSQYARKLFETLDTNNSGALDFREFVLGLYMLIQCQIEKDSGESQCDTDVIDTAFQMFGVSATKTMNATQAMELLKTSSPRITNQQAKDTVTKVFVGRDDVSIADFVAQASEREDFLDLMPNALGGLLKDRFVHPEETRRIEARISQ